MSKQKSDNRYRSCNECGTPFICPILARTRSPIYCYSCGSDNIAIISKDQYVKETRKRSNAFIQSGLNC